MVTEIREPIPGDAAAWLDMRCALWPDGTAEEHRAAGFEDAGTVRFFRTDL